MCRLCYFVWNAFLFPVFGSKSSLCYIFILYYSISCHSAPRRRHVFYLWHQWRWEHQHNFNGSSNGVAETLHVHSADPGSSPSGSGAGEASTADRPGLAAAEAMDEDRASLPEPRDSKRLKRGVPMPGTPTLSAEHNFVSGVLDVCCNPEQRRFALAYRKWLDTVIGQQL